MPNTQTKKTPIALITGGSRGLGRSMALHLAERGVDILFTYRAATAEASEVRERIHALGRKAVALPLDVANSASFEAFGTAVAAELERTWGRKQLDYLVHSCKEWIPRGTTVQVGLDVHDTTSSACWSSSPETAFQSWSRRPSSVTTRPPSGSANVLLSAATGSVVSELST